MIGQGIEEGVILESWSALRVTGLWLKGPTAIAAICGFTCEGRPLWEHSVPD